jgi:hypothetical protein
MTASPLLVRIDGDSIVFEADLCLAPDVDVCGDEVVPGTLTRVALPHMRVEMTYQEYVGDGYEWIDYVQQTDAEGRIAIPAGGQPMIGDVYGLRSDDIVVEQESPMPARRSGSVPWPASSSASDLPTRCPSITTLRWRRPSSTPRT